MKPLTNESKLKTKWWWLWWWPIHSTSPERSNSALNEYDLDEERMKKYLCVIKTLTVDRQERQLEVLFGLQELFHRLSYPKGNPNPGWWEILFDSWFEMMLQIFNLIDYDWISFYNYLTLLNSIPSQIFCTDCSNFYSTQRCWTKLHSTNGVRTPRGPWGRVWPSRRSVAFTTGSSKKRRIEITRELSSLPHLCV